MVCVRTGSSIKASLAMSQVQFPPLFVMFCITSVLYTKKIITSGGSLLSLDKNCEPDKLSLYNVSLLWQYFISNRKWTNILRLASFLEPLSECFSSFLPGSQGAPLSVSFFTWSYPYRGITSDWGLILTSYVYKGSFSIEDHLLRG